MAYRHEWEVAQEMCSTGTGERPWHMCVSSALEGQRGGCRETTCLEASAGEQEYGQGGKWGICLRKENLFVRLGKVFLETRE